MSSPEAILRGLLRSMMRIRLSTRDSQSPQKSAGRPISSRSTSKTRRIRLWMRPNGRSRTRLSLQAPKEPQAAAHHPKIQRKTHKRRKTSKAINQLQEVPATSTMANNRLFNHRHKKPKYKCNKPQTAATRAQKIKQTSKWLSRMLILLVCPLNLLKN